MGEHLGIHITINVSGSSNSSSGIPKVFVAIQDQQLFELDAPAKTVTVIHNGRVQVPITAEIPEGTNTHLEDSADVILNFPSDEGDIIQIIPFN